MNTRKDFTYDSMVVFIGEYGFNPAFSTHTELTPHGCILSTAATDAMRLKHHDIFTHSAD